MTKRLSQIVHAKRRAYQRFGVYLNYKAYRKLVQQIQQERAAFVERQSERVTVWLVTMPTGAPAFAVYDQNRRVIATFLTELGERKAEDFGREDGA